MIAGITCFAVGIELPKHYFRRHWYSVLLILLPVMSIAWLICGLLAFAIFRIPFSTALIISACLTPTDPVLASSVLSGSKFSARVPKRIRHLLAAESACNDGVSFPFLYAGIVYYTSSQAGEGVRDWVLYTLLWQCLLGGIVGFVIGAAANRLLRFSDKRGHISPSAFIVFYLLFAILSVGVGSTAGTDDFLVAFGAGVGFAHDGWFSKKIKSAHLPSIVDLVLNSSMFVVFGSIIPWSEFHPRDITPHCGIWQLVLFLVLILLFRRIPALLLMKRYIPDVRTYREALFCGHFGPIGVGALFLALEARAQLENGTTSPEPEPPTPTPPFSDREKAVHLVWPVICFVVLGSTMVHGLSVLVISLAGSLSRKAEERAPLLGGETDGLDAMDHEGGGGDSEPSVSGSEDGFIAD